MGSTALPQTPTPPLPSPHNTSLDVAPGSQRENLVYFDGESRVKDKMSSSNLQEDSKEAREYVDSVMASFNVAEVKLPGTVSSGRKRHLSLPEENSVENMKILRDIKKAKRTLYERNAERNTETDLTGDKSVTAESENSVSPRNTRESKQTNCGAKQGQADNSGNQRPKAPKGDGTKPKSKGKGARDKSSEQSGIAELVSAFDKMESRYSKMEQNMEKKFNDLEKVFQSKIDKFENHMVKRFTDMMNTAVTTLKEELGEEIDELDKRLRQIEENNENSNQMEVDSDKATQPGHNLNVVIRNLPERHEENIKSEVNGLIKDGLRLRDIAVESAERKPSAVDSRSGIVIAKLKNREDKLAVMKNKSKLKDSRRYQNVFVEHDLPKHQRVLNANIRTIVKTLGKQDLQFEGSRVRVKDRTEDRSRDVRGSGERGNRTDSRYTGTNQPRRVDRDRRDRSPTYRSAPERSADRDHYSYDDRRDRRDSSNRSSYRQHYENEQRYAGERNRRDGERHGRGSGEERRRERNHWHSSRHNYQFQGSSSRA